MRAISLPFFLLSSVAAGCVKPYAAPRTGESMATIRVHSPAGYIALVQAFDDESCSGTRSMGNTTNLSKAYSIPTNKPFVFSVTDPAPVRLCRVAMVFQPEDGAEYEGIWSVEGRYCYLGVFRVLSDPSGHRKLENVSSARESEKKCGR